MTWLQTKRCAHIAQEISHNNVRAFIPYCQKYLFQAKGKGLRFLSPTIWIPIEI